MLESDEGLGYMLFYLGWSGRIFGQSDIWAKIWMQWGNKPCEYLGEELSTQSVWQMQMSSIGNMIFVTEK